MKTAIRHILTGLFVVLTLSYLVVTLSASSTRRDSLTCNGVRVIVKDSARIGFVTARQVKGYLETEMPGYRGKPCREINLDAVEDLIDGKSAVLKSEAYFTKDGMLNVKIVQREPLVRFQNGSHGFYADRQGYIFPLQENYTARVPIVEGHIPVTAPDGFKGRPEKESEALWLDGMIDLLNFIRKNDVWSRDIVQICVARNGDLVLIPREGREKFVFGKPDGVERKFKRIEEYYKSVRPSKEDGYYSIVNVKYDGQLICRR
ncbi:MAG: cell division protein FtsQ/DivIB [Candidatus Cryptobacteroides sp.]